MKTINSKTILFITGAFVSNRCWDDWKIYFEKRGYKTYTPAWHHKEGAPHFLRDSQPNAQIASIRMSELIEQYSSVAKGLPEKPIVIGHSLGGLLTQILVNRGFAAAGIAIHSLAPQGIIPTQFSFYKSTWRALGFFTSTRESYLMSFKKWQYAFTNGMSLAEQEEGYERFLIPESKLVLRDGLTSVAKVDFKKPHAPLLFLAGSSDHCIPAALNLANMKKYKDRNSVTDYIVLKGRNHFVLGQSTWRGDADCILDWIESMSPVTENTYENAEVVNNQTLSNTQYN